MAVWATQNATHDDDLGPSQLVAVEQLALGATVIRAAEAAGVGRETVHRWNREDLAFQAAVNGARRDLQDAVNRRLLAVAGARHGQCGGSCVEQGNLSASLSILKGLGVFGGQLPTVVVMIQRYRPRRRAQREQAAKSARMLASLCAGL